MKTKDKLIFVVAIQKFRNKPFQIHFLTSGGVSRENKVYLINDIDIKRLQSFIFILQLRLGFIELRLAW